MRSTDGMTWHFKCQDIPSVDLITYIISMLWFYY